MAACLVGYLVPWSALGIVAVWASDLSWSHSRWAIAGTFALATAWTLLPIRERAMVRWSGYAPVVAPSGWAAVRDCTRAGLIVGAWCVVSCWALMLACAFSGHHLGALAAGGTIGVDPVIVHETIFSRVGRADDVLRSLVAAHRSASIDGAGVDHGPCRRHPDDHHVNGGR
jgi:hypothetical protein